MSALNSSPLRSNTTCSLLYNWGNPQMRVALIIFLPACTGFWCAYLFCYCFRTYSSNLFFRNDLSLIICIKIPVKRSTAG